MAEKTPEDVRNLKIANAIKQAKRVGLIVYFGNYHGKVESVKAGEYILYSVSNVDENIVRTMVGDDHLELKVYLKDGEAPVTFPTKLLNKKLPKLLLGFPTSISKKVDRKHPRRPTNLKTPIFLTKREKALLPDETMGVGQISNVSEGGCSISTPMDIRVGDKIEIYMEVEPSKKKRLAMDIDNPAESDNLTDDRKLSLDLTGIVKNRRSKDDDTLALGVEFYKLSPDVKGEVIAYMKRKGSDPA